ncbi:dihydroorotase [Sulfobacillus harzensis]|uniref:Dihydroorotase family protein n=1 Tax=Sulfobacillus harzensis TaxID=2729629 RepID=A0A7Y0L166_9FIRM|nr:dihydroorotase family protein [Sulfobacillus harzensis]NMP21411.1 dihydroorotase family protein [Sulfobacillus harzensis]
MFELGIEGAHVAIGGELRPVNVYVEQGRFRAFSDTVLEAKQRIQATGLLMFPGVIDSHVHSRDPGLTHKEDFLHSTRAAAAGGVTTVLEMPNSVPPVTDRASFLSRQAHLAEQATVDFGMWGMVTSETSPQDIEDLSSLGVSAFKLFWGYALDRETRALVYVPKAGQPVIPPPDNGRVLELFQLLAQAKKVLAVHAEDNAIIAFRSQHAGESRDAVERLLWERPVVAEAATMELAAEFSQATGCAVHVVHMSSKAGVDIVRRARRSGIDMTAETCPQYLALTADDVKALGPVAKVYPPIRHAEDREALLAGLASGAVAFVASDHAPHAAAEKAVPFAEAPAGFAGVQTLFPVLLDLALRGQLPMACLPDILSRHPAERYGLFRIKGAIDVGFDADFVLVDPRAKTHLGRAELYSLNPENPWMGTELKGRITATYLRGQAVMENGKIVAHAGRFIKPEAR